VPIVPAPVRRENEPRDVPDQSFSTYQPTRSHITRRPLQSAVLNHSARTTQHVDPLTVHRPRFFLKPPHRSRFTVSQECEIMHNTRKYVRRTLYII